MDHFCRTFLLHFALFGAWQTSYNTLSLNEKKTLKIIQNIVFTFHKIKKVILVLEWHEGEQMMAGLKITSPQNNQSPWSISLLDIVSFYFSLHSPSVFQRVCYSHCAVDVSARPVKANCDSSIKNRLWLFREDTVSLTLIKSVSPPLTHV